MKPINNPEIASNLIRKNLEKAPWTIIHVTPDGDLDPLPGFTYTLGLTTMGLPELVVTGNIPSDVIKGILDTVVDMAVDKGKFTEGIVDVGSVLASGEALRFYLRPVRSRLNVVRAYAIQADARYGNEAEYWQLLWADTQNILPTERGYSLTFLQPLL